MAGPSDKRTLGAGLGNTRRIPLGEQPPTASDDGQPPAAPDDSSEPSARAWLLGLALALWFIGIVLVDVPFTISGAVGVTCLLAAIHTVAIWRGMDG